MPFQPEQESNTCSLKDMSTSQLLCEVYTNTYCALWITWGALALK